MKLSEKESQSSDVIETQIKFNVKQLAFILDAIDCYEDYGDFTTSDGIYTLTENEVNEFIRTILEEFKSLISKKDT